MRATAPSTSQQQSSVINNNQRVICNGNTTAEAAARENVRATKIDIMWPRTQNKKDFQIYVCVCAIIAIGRL